MCGYSGNFPTKLLSNTDIYLIVGIVEEPIIIFSIRIVLEKLDERRLLDHFKKFHPYTNNLHVTRALLRKLRPVEFSINFL